MKFISLVLKNTSAAFILCCFVLTSSNVLSAQTLHFIIATQSEGAEGIGSQQDKINMKALAQEIEQNVPGLSVKTTLIDGAYASKSRIQNELSSSIGPNDVVWYYYSGHGINYDTWPMSAEEDVPLTWVHNELKRTPARLTIAMYDCCTWDLPTAEPPSGLRPRSSYYKFLFLEAKGNIIAASCSSTQFSYGKPSVGGLYTNNFIDALRSQSKWENILKAAKESTIVSAREDGENQIPIYDIQVETTTPVAAPSVPTKRYNSLSAVAQAMTRACHANGKRGAKVNIGDIQRWNPGVTNSNFKSFNRLEFKPNDPLLK